MLIEYTLFYYFLGKAYQEKRIDKRERRQPQVIPDLPYLNWEKTGQAPAGPYAVCSLKGS